MKIYPAIDLLQGQAVRLFKGDYAQVSVVDPDPVALVQRFAADGSSCLHVVDLDGARDGSASHYSLIARMIKDSKLFVQVGGGLRHLERMQHYQEIGVSRLIVGTVAVEEPELLQKAISAFGPKLAVACDVKDGCIAVRGWTANSSLGLDDFCRRMATYGVRTLIVTDVSRDGTLTGGNLELYRHLKATTEFDLIASGGIADLSDLDALRKIDVAGTIVGKALYNGNFTLKQALQYEEQDDVK